MSIFSFFRHGALAIFSGFLSFSHELCPFWSDIIATLYKKNQLTINPPLNRSCALLNAASSSSPTANSTISIESPQKTWQQIGLLMEKNCRTNVFCLWRTSFNPHLQSKQLRISYSPQLQNSVYLWERYDGGTRTSKIMVNTHTRLPRGWSRLELHIVDVYLPR